ncbi:MAG TPA: PLP-dependent aspartate aminotransferase family protein [Gammaproteobacteria bacterium]|nr:PLP-dependent aspartate aminotransferase family protein [Gammaproteobacteria bacterium]
MKELQTRAIHAGREEPRIAGAVITPIFQSSIYEYHGEAYHDVGYIRLSTTPNHRVLARRIADLEGSEDALVTGSGMAAVAGILLSVLSSGDHLLVQRCTYGGTGTLLDNDLARLGIAATPIDAQDAESWKRALTRKARAIYVETLTNPVLELADLEAIVAFAREHALVSIIDNTFASPVLCRPAELGFDLVLESCTKYMNGHNDLSAGSIAGSVEQVRRIKHTLDHLGGHLDAHGCFLLERGLKTLGLRVAYQAASAARIAEYLAGHSAIARVNYPGLPTHPQHARAKRLLGGFGGMMSFELVGGLPAAEELLARLTIPVHAPSLGGAESLIVRPAAAVHSAWTPEQRAASGINDGLVRFSVGLEGTEDLIADLAQALDLAPRAMKAR